MNWITTMFGWTLIRKEELKELHAGWTVSRRVLNCHRWFSGWKDLDVIWDYLMSPTYFGDISSARDKYAAARGTDCYGKVKES